MSIFDSHCWVLPHVGKTNTGGIYWIAINYFGRLFDFNFAGQALMRTSLTKFPNDPKWTRKEYTGKWRGKWWFTGVQWFIRSINCLRPVINSRGHCEGQVRGPRVGYNRPGNFPRTLSTYSPTFGLIISTWYPILTNHRHKKEFCSSTKGGIAYRILICFKCTC